MKRSTLVTAAVARTSLIAMTAFTLAIAVRVVGSELPPGHPPVDVERLPVGHPPIDDLRPQMPVFPQGGTSTT
jgi:hypothetical protein